MAREFRHALEDIRAELRGIRCAVAGKSLDDYKSDRLLRHAIQCAIEIVTEASSALPDEVKAIQPEIPSAKVRTIGNVLRHEYHGLSDHIIWGVVIDELPPLGLAIDTLCERFSLD